MEQLPKSNPGSQKSGVPSLFKWLCLVFTISVGYYIVEFFISTEISQSTTTTTTIATNTKENYSNVGLGENQNVYRNDINEPRMIHWNSTDRKSKPTIYYCHPNDGNGMKEIKTMMTNVLPEYKLVKLNEERNQIKDGKTYLRANYTNEYDIFTGHFEQYCPPSIERWLHTHFNGHIVLFSGESRFAHPIQAHTDTTGRMHAFGPIFGHEHEWQREGDMTLYYLQLTWWQYFQDYLPPSSMISSSKRPRGDIIKSEEEMTTTTTTTSVAANKHFMIYANSNCVDFRELAVGQLSEIGIIHCDGKCQGNVTSQVGNQTNIVNTKFISKVKLRNWWGNIQRFSNYRFCLVMEHTGDHPGYITKSISRLGGGITCWACGTEEGPVPDEVPRAQQVI